MNYEKICEQTKYIYAHLADRVSKRIYSNRVLYNLTEDDKYLRNVFREWDWEHKFVSDLNSFEASVCIYGAGDFGKRLVRFFHEISWCCFVDKKSKEILCINDISVISPDEYLQKYKDLPIVISIKDGYENIKSELILSGIPSNHIICLFDYLADMKNIYFDLEEMQPGPNEVFADVGVYDGQSTLDFVRWSKNGYSGSYMFEPNGNLKEAICSKLEKVPDCRYVPCGVWNQDGLVNFMTADNAVGSFLSEGLDNNNLVKVVSLDSYFEKEGIYPTYIKMDIEGAELKALQGAEKIIKSKKPKLAISIYHKKEDLWTIPELVLSYRLDYKLYIRHYTMECADTVLYAI